MIDIHRVMRPNKLKGFVRNGDMVLIVDSPDDADGSVYMRVGMDGSDQDPRDYPNHYFEFGRRSEPVASDAVDSEGEEAEEYDDMAEV